ncbi:hypothetical protein C8R44DRAFT_741749 [Mycena epipterygia]|nr:hypothetical protein C8R44DRAFT_741749 [Mycena epipterygia]
MFNAREQRSRFGDLSLGQASARTFLKIWCSLKMKNSPYWMSPWFNLNGASVASDPWGMFRVPPVRRICHDRKSPQREIESGQTSLPSGASILSISPVSLGLWYRHALSPTSAQYDPRSIEHRLVFDFPEMADPSTLLNERLIKKIKAFNGSTLNSTLIIYTPRIHSDEEVPFILHHPDEHR